MGEFDPDPAKYAEMAKPFDDPKDAENSLRAFMEKVKQLRENYRIAEVVIAAQVYTADESRARSGSMLLGSLINGFALSDAMTDEFGKTVARSMVKEKLPLIMEDQAESAPFEQAKPEGRKKKKGNYILDSRK